MEKYVSTVMELGSFEGTPMQLRQAVLDQITTYPETHDQEDWVGNCGTTACVAGWSLMLRDGRLPSDQPWNIAEQALKALDLTPYDAMRLFHYTTKDQAKLALKFLANGESINWAHVGHRFPHRKDRDVHRMITNEINFFLEHTASQ